MRMRELGPSNLKIAGNLSLKESEAKNLMNEMAASKIDIGEWLYDTTK